jgi:hypothetical protein
MINKSIRIRGLVKFIIGIALTVVLVFLLLGLRAEGFHFLRWGLILVGIPGAYGLAGLIECISGISFLELSKKWDSLAGWQRGVLGIGIVILFFIFVIGFMALWAYLAGI